LTRRTQAPLPDVRFFCDSRLIEYQTENNTARNE
jgi:hypothetical protein